MTARPPHHSPGLVERSRLHGSRIAIRSNGADHTYDELRERSACVAAALLSDAPDLDGERVVLLAPIGFEYLAMQWAIWRAGGVVVPISTSATLPEVAHALADSAARIALVTRDLADRIANGSPATLQRLVVFEDVVASERRPLPVIEESRPAMMLYTSGTTSHPKGVVTTHANLRAQIETLVAAWEWSAEDRIPLFLPMHHIHGIVNVACCALWAGATIEAFPKFKAASVLERVAAGAFTVFMAVPTIYVNLIETLESDRLPHDAHRRALRGFADMRLMVSGSAALPPSIHEKWAALTGQRLLERYGMTETGMILSNPLHGERRQGAVGQPLPSMEVRLKSEQGTVITSEGEPGEVQVRGPMVFREYWNQPEATAASFDGDWFRTGDMAVLEDSYYRILGRLSVDIIKSGGYKLSALEIEAAVLEHPAIRECAVVGVADEKWGEIVAVAAILEPPDRTLALDELREWSLERLSPYKIPRKLLVLDKLPRNAMGKVQKRVVSQLFAESRAPAA